MKKLIIISILLLFLQFTNCKNYLVTSYRVVLPSVPPAWVSILGEPCWKIQWFDTEAIICSQEIESTERPVIELPSTWVNPVTAWPFWPRHNLLPEIFKPAGAIFPHDINGSNINLTWEAGIDAVFYHELAIANSNEKTKIPANFDWLRFRELLQSSNVLDEVKNDPWLVNWKSVAERTISGNFDRRRLVPETTVLTQIPVSSNLWYATSPFTEPLIFNEDDTSIFPVRPGLNIWISMEGILKVNGDTWVFRAN